MRTTDWATNGFISQGLGAALVLGLLAAAPAARAADVAKDQETPPSIVGSTIADFILADQDGDQVALTDFSDQKAVVVFFMGTGCPIANLYLSELMELNDSQPNVQVIGIHSNAGLTQEAVAEHAKEYNVTVPVLLDKEQRIADQFGATRTAEVFLIDQHRVVRYHGRIDDRFGYTYKREEPRRADLKLALAELLADKPITVAATEPAGCLITRIDRQKTETEVTYAKHVSRIIQQRCHECHRPGMVAPFELLDYDDAVEWSEMIKEVIVQKRMPPWHADPRFGHFSNNRYMPQDEVDQLVAWIDGGMPMGDEKDLPAPREYAEGWAIDRPDVVFQLPKEVTVPADGVVPYLYYSVPTNFKEDMWIQQAEARPGNRAVVHHIIVFFRTPGSDSKRRGHIAGTAPGDPPMILPPGVAKKVPAGAELIFQMHYTPTGKEETDRSEVGFVFYKGDEPPKYTARTKAIINHGFRIPAGEANHRVESSYTVPHDTELFAMMPHMHLRGKDFKFTAEFPDGRQEVLLSVPAYDFNWQNTYRLHETMQIPKGTRIDCVAHFDNSPDNPANPDPSEEVTWGDQTWEEMMIGWTTFLESSEHAGTYEEEDE